MKKITTITSAALFMLASFSSCKKDSNLISEPVQRKLVKVELSGGGTNTTNYTYNAQGRLVEIKNNSFTNQLDYTGSLFFRTTIDNSTAKKAYESSTTSVSAEKVTGIETKSFKPDGSINYIEPNSFQYSTEGYQTNFAYFGYSYAKQYNGGNLMQTIGTLSGSPHSNSTFEYYTDKLDKLNLNWFEATFQDQYLNDKELFGKKNKNLLKKSIEAYPGGNTYGYDFVYTFDTEGYITTCTATESTNGSTSAVYNYKFIYQ